MRDVAMVAISSAYRANSTWREGLSMSLTYRLKRTGDINPPCAAPARMPRRDDVAVRKDASNVRLRRYDEMMWTRYDRKIKDGQLVKEDFDSNGIEGFGHVQEKRACQSPLAEIPCYSFNEAGQLQGRAMPGSKPRLFVPQHPNLAYFM